MNSLEAFTFMDTSLPLSALVAVELNSYIAILAPPKPQKATRNSGAKLIFF